MKVWFGINLTNVISVERRLKCSEQRLCGTKAWSRLIRVCKEETTNDSVYARESNGNRWERCLDVGSHNWCPSFEIPLAICLLYLELHNPRYYSYVLLLFLGSGTMIASCFGERWSKTLFFVGLFHLFLAYIIIGWVFSIYWGYLIIKRSTKDKGELEQFIDIH